MEMEDVRVHGQYQRTLCKRGFIWANLVREYLNWFKAFAWVNKQLCMQQRLWRWSNAGAKKSCDKAHPRRPCIDVNCGWRSRIGPQGDIADRQAKGAERRLMRNSKWRKMDYNMNVRQFHGNIFDHLIHSYSMLTIKQGSIQERQDHRSYQSPFQMALKD